MSFVNVPAESIFQTLETAGFVKTVQGNEVVYERPHKNPQFKIRVFTSVRLGAGQVRGVGEDAMHVTLVRTYNGGRSFVGAGKSTRINRTGTVDGVLARMLDRAREMWKVASVYSRQFGSPHAP